MGLLFPTLSKEYAVNRMFPSFGQTMFSPEE